MSKDVQPSIDKGFTLLYVRRGYARLDKEWAQNWAQVKGAATGPGPLA